MKGFLLGLFMILGGGVVIYYHEQLHKMFGDIARAEKLFGDSRSVYPLIGTGMIVFGILIMFGFGGVSESTQIDSSFVK